MCFYRLKLSVLSLQLVIGYHTHLEHLFPLLLPSEISFDKLVETS